MHLTIFTRPDISYAVEKVDTSVRIMIIGLQLINFLNI